MSNLTTVRDPWLNSLRRRRDEFFTPLEQHFNKFFDEFFSTGLHNVKALTGFPRMNVTEEDGQLVVRTAVAGVDPANLKVELVPSEPVLGVEVGPTLRISGQMSESHASGEKAVYHLRELKQSMFSREIKLPEYIKEDPQAVLKDGVLTLSWVIPKAEEAPKNTVRQIQIKSE